MNSQMRPRLSASDGDSFSNAEPEHQQTSYICALKPLIEALAWLQEERDHKASMTMEVSA